MQKALMNERQSISPFSRRRLTRDWRILAEHEEEHKYSKFTSRRKTVDNQIVYDSLLDFHELTFNNLEFVTGSYYAGQWSQIGINGNGRYTFPHGVVYEGPFRDGMFHGEGKLIYPQGQALKCTFQKGKMIEWKFLFGQPKRTSDDGDEYSSSSSDDTVFSSEEGEENEFDVETYCKPPDRRFLISHSKGLKGALKETKTNVQPTRKIPKGCYDVGDGFYNPKTKWVHKSGDMDMIDSLLYMVPEKERNVELTTERQKREFAEKIPSVPIYKSEKWIKDHCRKAWDENVGYRPDLYEYWFSGKNREREDLDMCYDSEGGKFVEEKSINEDCLKSFRDPLADLRYNSI